MTLAELSIKRPIFITCVVLLSLAVGILSLRKLPVDLFPDVAFPIVIVTIVYPGAGPQEIETLVSKPLEEELSSIGGLKRLKSLSKEGVSRVIAEFTLETDVKYAEQQIRDRASSAKRRLPLEIEEPVIRRIDPADQPILILGISSSLKEGELFQLVDTKIRPKVEQVNQVGLVEIIGGRKREIQIDLDRKKLKERELSVSLVANRLKATGQNIPAGQLKGTTSDTIVRTLGEFQSLEDIRNTVVNFVGNDVPISISDLGTVVDGLEEEKSRAFVNGKKGIFLMVFRQSGANTIAVADHVKGAIAKLNSELKSEPGSPLIQVVRDGAIPIHANVDDVRESIFLGIILTIIVVFYFLGSGKSTLITGLALPNSLMGAFILMSLAGFSVNIMTLLALSLAIGLLIDDAIVVRENIFRHIEMGKKPIPAALEGTKEVTLAVIATTLTVIAVFGPIAFLKGVVGQFFREFGLTICFIMAISLFDALTVAPMLSAYYAGTASHGPRKRKNPLMWLLNASLQAFERLQTSFENLYEKVLAWSLRHPFKVLLGALAIFLVSLLAAKQVPKTFLPAQDDGEFSVSIQMPPGTNLNKTTEVALEVDKVLRANAEILVSTTIVGNNDGDSEKATFFISLVPSKQRKFNTSQMKDRIREQLTKYSFANPVVKDIDMIGGGQRPFSLNIVGSDLNQLVEISTKVVQKLKTYEGLKDVDMGFRPGKPEFQVAIDQNRAEQLGVSSALVGMELRGQIEGIVPVVLREKGEEFDVRVRLNEAQRDLKEGFAQTYVPNINNTLVKLSNVARPVTTTGLSNIDRQDRGRYINIAADITPGGPGMGGAITEVARIFKDDIPLPTGVKYSFEGQAENFKELIESMVMAALLGILFIYLVLASLYESFVIPLTIMLVLPLAACGAFYALFVTQTSLDLFSMIGCILLLGLATKNSILLVDYTNQLIAEGKDRTQALIHAGHTRLRPILMTSFALIAGMLPVALGLNEASRQRTSLGIAVIGGILSSTFLTLLVIPAAFSYMDQFRHWSRLWIARLFLAKVESNGRGKHSELEASL